MRAMARERVVYALAIVLMMAALAGIGLAVWSGQQRVAIQGPWALAALPGGQVWLSVDDALWRFDRAGQRQAVVPLTQAGLSDKVAVLMPHPSGALVAWVRGSPTLHLLDAQSGAPQSRITPAWPEEFGRHGTDAITFAFAPDARVAIATGGGHAVALFDAAGRYLARTPADTYRFTNGLWWSPEGWWTTDTNRPALLRLDDADLKPRLRVKLLDGFAPDRYFLNMAAASHGAASGYGAPLGSVARVGTGMTFGEVVDVFDNGRQTAFPLPLDEEMDLRALAWQDERLLVVDGNGFAVRQYSAGRRLLGDWGDAATQAELTARYEQKQAWQWRYDWGLKGGGVLLVLGFAMALWHQQLKTETRLADLPPARQPPPKAERRIAGEPARLSPGERMRLMLPAMWPALALAAALPMLTIVMPSFLSSDDASRASALRLTLVFIAGATVLVFFTLHRGMRKLQTEAASEALLNERARLLLARPEPFWPLREEGETPRETLLLMRMRGGQWLVLTNQRLLLFKVSGNSATFDAAWPRQDVVGAGVSELAHSRSLLDRLGSMLLPGAMRLKIVLRDGERIEGVAQSAQVARRIAQLLGVRAAAALRGRTPRRADRQTDRRRAAAEAPLDRKAMLASLLLPGLGQRMQGRIGLAAGFFAAWALALLQFAFVCWSWWISRTEVSIYSFIYSGGLLALVYLGAAMDARHMTTARR